MRGPALALALALVSARCVSDFVASSTPPPSSPAPGRALTFETQPSSAIAGQSLGNVRIAIRDSSGSIATGVTASVGVALTPGSASSGAQLAGTTTVDADHGIAVFSNLSIAKAGTGYALAATSGGLSGDQSSAFSIAAGPMASVIVTPASATLGAVGATRALTAQGQDANGNPVPNPSFTWTSSDGSIASVDGSGSVTARANGTATIGAASGGMTGNATITVQQVAASVVVSPAGPDTLTAFGAARTYSAQVRDANGSPIAGRTIAWSSSATGVATIGAGSSTATAVGNGTTTVQATADGVSGTATLVVRQSVGSVSIAPNDFMLPALGSQALAATALDPNGNTVTRALSWSWQSDNTFAVTVAQSPTDGSQATASRSAPGTATITATAGGKSGTATAR